MSLYKKGCFGNAAPTWDLFEDFCIDWQDSWESNLFHIRNKLPGAQTWYDVRGDLLEDLWFDIAAPMFQENQLYISAMCPTEKTTLQGEVRLSIHGMELTYSTVKKPMRAALAEKTQIAYGLTAMNLLKANLNATCYDWLQTLLEDYPEHIIEFTALSICWGTLPGQNTCFWEVRPDRQFSSNHSPFTQVY